MAQPKQAGGGPGEARAGGGLLGVGAGTDPRPDPRTDLGKGPTYGPFPRMRLVASLAALAPRTDRLDVAGEQLFHLGGSAEATAHPL